MKQESWSVSADGPNCVKVVIDPSIDLTGLEIKLINDLRQPFMKQKLESHTLTLCSSIDMPVYAQIADSMKYVSGSGDAYYRNR